LVSAGLHPSVGNPAAARALRQEPKNLAIVLRVGTPLSPKRRQLWYEVAVYGGPV
jgi:hypothetical protein